MAAEKDAKAVADQKAQADAKAKTAEAAVAPASNSVDQAKRDELGDGKVADEAKNDQAAEATGGTPHVNDPEPATTADEEESKNVVGRSVAAKAVTALEQNPDLSAITDRARPGENPNRPKGTTDLIWRCGNKVALGKFFIIESDVKTYTFEEGVGIAVNDEDVDQLLEKAADSDDLYTIDRA